MKRLIISCLCVAFWLSHTVHAEPLIQSGDRIAIIGNTFADQLRIHGYLETLMRQRLDLSVRNLGWGGDMLTSRDRPTGFPSEEETLTEHQTDVIIACFGMGESFEGEAGVPRFKTDLENFIASHAGKKYNGKSPVKLILVSPIAHEDLGNLTPRRERRNEELKAYTQAMGEIAANHKVPFVDLFEPSLYLMNKLSEATFTTNGITLNEFGYWALSHTFFEQLVSETVQPWIIQVDVKTNTGTATGVELVDISAGTSGVSFSVVEQTVPSLRPPVDSRLPSELAMQRDRLIVSQLAPGDYTLTIDALEIVTASHLQWADGVPVDFSPSHIEAEALRKSINNKNLQFTYSWKALNQVHIVGERKRSPSGQALPAEVIEFNQLAKQQESQLSKPNESLPRQRQWRLVRVQKNLP